ncbi:RNA-guided endonuclease TnpB family protein, partial [Paraburkholderia sediminicola]|uniref:RNA-guided endonuclease TnpB family protein n=1 Tax=Paraburkholderia sediminicola TaxID=458836 RepID=UPI0038B8ACCA
MSVKRALRFRFYPTAEQEQQLAQHFGCVRFVYNHMLARRQQRYKDGLKSNYADDAAALTALKQRPECVWLRDVSIVALQASLRHLDTAYKNFFSRRTGFPRFKRKRAAQSYSLMRNGFTLRGGRLTLAKMTAPLDVRWSRKLPGIPSSLTVSRDAAGRYFVSLLCDDDVVPLPPTGKVVAADLGLTHFLTFADDQPPLSPPKFLAELLHRVRRLSRALSRKDKGSKNREKARERLARLHARIADSRKDFLHKVSTQLIRENQAVFMEDLCIKGMMRGHLARSIGDAAWGAGGRARGPPGGGG